MNLVAIEITFLSTCMWITFQTHGQHRPRGPEARINIGFIRDVDAETIQQAIGMAVTLSENVSNRTVEIDSFVNVSRIGDCYAMSNAVCWLLMETVYTIIGAANVTSYDVLEAYSQAMHVPIILYNGVRKTSRPNYKYLLHIVPSYINAVVDYLKYYKWKTVFYLHDERDPLWTWKVSEFFSLVNENNIHIVQRSLEFPTLSYEQLRFLDHTDLPKGQTEKVFVVDLSGEPLNLFFTQIMQLGMNRKGYHYIIGGLEIKSVDVKHLLHGGCRVTGFQLTLNELGKKKIKPIWDKYIGTKVFSMPEVFLIDSVCFLHHALQQIHKKESSGFFRTRGQGKHWNTNLIKEVICHKNTYLQKGSIIIDYLKRTSADCLTGTISFDENGNRKHLCLDVYSMSREPFHKIGQWCTERGYVETKPISPSDGESQQQPYIVTLVVESPFVSNYTDKHGKEVFEGYCIDMFNKIVNNTDLKLNYVIRKRNDTKYGKVINQETNEWDGMISELIKGEADIALGSITITEKRQEVVDFTKPFMNTGISIMIKRPDKQKPNVFSFKEPFSNSMWACIMCGFAGVSLVLVLIGRFSPYEWQNNSSDGPSEDFSVLNSLWSSFGALLQQGSDYLPSSVSGRVAECAWWFFTLIIVSSYTANLAAFLTVEKLNIPIDSADALARQTKIKYGFTEGGSTNDFFKNSIVPTYKKMYQFVERTVPSPTVNSNKKGWEKVKESKGEYAFLLESTTNEYYNQQKPCNTMKVGDNLNQNGYGIATRKGSPLSRQLNLALLQLIEKGELINLKQRWWYDKGQCGQSVASKGKQSLSLSNVAGTFHIVILGLVVAMIFSALEFMYHYRKRKHSKKKVIQTVLITDIDNDIEESQPLKPTLNGAKENQGYQTTMNSPANLIMFESITENGSTML